MIGDNKCARLDVFIAKSANLPAMGAMLLGGSHNGLIVGGGLLFGVTRAKNYSGRNFTHIIFRPFGKRCFVKNSVTFYKWRNRKVVFSLISL